MVTHGREWSQIVTNRHERSQPVANGRKRSQMSQISQKSQKSQMFQKSQKSQMSQKKDENVRPNFITVTVVPSFYCFLQILFSFLVSSFQLLIL